MWGRSNLLASEDFFGKLKNANSEQDITIGMRGPSLNNTLEGRLRTSIDPDNIDRTGQDPRKQKFMTDLRQVRDFDCVKQYFLNAHFVNSISAEDNGKSDTKVHMLIHKQNITKLSFGSNFMAVLTERGEVLKLDEPERGQPANKLTAISSSFFEGHRVVDISAGHSYVLLLTSHHQVFSMGIGAAGTLGHGKDVTVQLKPRKIDFQQKIHPEIFAIEAGLSHAAAFTRTGKVYIWGYGGDGRLGIGNNDGCFYPRIVDQLESETIIGVSCG